MEPASLPLLLCIRDLLFASKVTATARANNIPFRGVRDFSRLLETPAEHLVIDLNAPGAVEAAAAWRAKFGGKVTGFVAHVAGPVIAAAREAGLDRVLSNGAFTARIDSILRGDAIVDEPSISADQ